MMGVHREQYEETKDIGDKISMPVILAPYLDATNQHGRQH